MLNNVIRISKTNLREISMGDRLLIQKEKYHQHVNIMRTHLNKNTE